MEGGGEIGGRKCKWIPGDGAEKAPEAAISKDSTSSKPEMVSKHLIRGVAKFIVVKRTYQQIVASYGKLENQVHSIWFITADVK